MYDFNNHGLRCSVYNRFYNSLCKVDTSMRLRIGERFVFKCDACQFEIVVKSVDAITEEKKLIEKGWIVKPPFGQVGGTHVCHVCKQKATEPFQIISAKIAEALIISGCDVEEAWIKANEHIKKCLEKGLTVL